MNAHGRPLMIAITGGSGAGKTWLASRLLGLFGETTSPLSQDDFYRDRSALPSARRDRINFDHPRALDWPCFERFMRECRAGRATPRPRYDFATHARRSRAEWWQPQPVVIVEGLWPLWLPSACEWFDLSIFLDAPADLRLERRLRRDATERGRSPDAIRRQFFDTVEPMHRRYVLPQARRADLVLEVPFTPSGIARLGDHFWRLLISRSWTSGGRREAFQAKMRVLANAECLSYA